jgi:hypothetical protein
MLYSDCYIWIFQIFGIALGFNLLFECDDLVTGVCFATVVPNLLPYAISHLVKLLFQQGYLHKNCDMLMCLYVCWLLTVYIYSRERIWRGQ